MLQPTTAVRTPFRTGVSAQMPLALRALSVRRRNCSTAARAEGKVNREYNEESGKTSSGKDKPLYADELPVSGSFT